MAKKMELHDKGKIRGIRRRWLLNSVGVVLLILALALGTFIASLRSYYYTGTTDDLMSRASSTAYSFRNYTSSEYSTVAQRTVSEYEEKGLLELQFLDETGAVLYSGNDLAAGTTPDTPDIQGALEDQETTPWIGRDPSTGSASLPPAAQWSIRAIPRG